MIKTFFIICLFSVSLFAQKSQTQQSITTAPVVSSEARITELEQQVIQLKQTVQNAQIMMVAERLKAEQTVQAAQIMMLAEHLEFDHVQIMALIELLKAERPPPPKKKKSFLREVARAAAAPGVWLGIGRVLAH